MQFFSLLSQNFSFLIKFPQLRFSFRQSVVLLDEISCDAEAIDGIGAPIGKASTVIVTPLAGTTPLFAQASNKLKQSGFEHLRFHFLKSHKRKGFVLDSKSSSLTLRTQNGSQPGLPVDQQQKLETKMENFIEKDDSSEEKIPVQVYTIYNRIPSKEIQCMIEKNDCLASASYE